MFESEIASPPSGIRVGRIAFCVVAALPVVAFIHIVIYPGTDKDSRMTNSIIGFLSLALSLLMSVIGFIAFAWVKRTAKRFWLWALVFAASPIIYWVLAVIVELIVGRQVLLR